MKKTVLMSAAKKARIALAVMAVCVFTFAGAQEAFAAAKENVIVDYQDNIIGAGNPAYVTGRYNVVLGIVTEAKGESNVAIGDSAKAKGDASTAVGAGAQAENGGAAIGHYSQATRENSIALGTGAKASATGAVALGALSTADEENTVSIGGIYQEIVGYDPATRDPIYENKFIARRIVNVADGTKNTDAATFGQIIKAGEYNLTLAADGSGQVTLQTNAGANGPTIKVDASALAGGGSTLTQDDFNNMLNASTKFNDLQTAVGNKANANGDNITTGAGSKWAETLGTGAIVDGDKNLVNGGTVYNKIGDTSQLTTAGLGSNLSDAVVKVNTKAEAAQTTATNALNKANANETKIGDTGKLTTAGLGSNLSDAVVKVNDKVGDTSKLTTAGLGNNLSDAVVKVDDKTKQNAKDIEKVNGRVDELGGRVDTLGGAVSKLDSRVNKVGAGAAALAALHPMEFDSDNKLSFAAGVGNYRGTNAAAIGAFYRPSEQVMFSISGNMGNGENMVNAGVSFALDRPSKTPTTKAALVKTVVAQNEQIAALNETVAEQNEKIARLEAMVEKLAAKQNA
ncbi:YadA-like family protein [Phascolarctobacterium sp.]|uniref:YadA-like family protein n=1 Tax=Phascolarctobacterium sp. TaxID=2049039 RepID=UPI003F81D1FA